MTHSAYLKRWGLDGIIYEKVHHIFFPAYSAGNETSLRVRPGAELSLIVFCKLKRN